MPCTCSRTYLVNEPYSICALSHQILWDSSPDNHSHAILDSPKSRFWDLADIKKANPSCPPPGKDSGLRALDLSRGYSSGDRLLHTCWGQKPTVSLLLRLSQHCQAGDARLSSPDTQWAPYWAPKEPRGHLRDVLVLPSQGAWEGQAPSVLLAWLPATSASCAPSPKQKGVQTPTSL